MPKQNPQSLRALQTWYLHLYQDNKGPVPVLIDDEQFALHLGKKKHASSCFVNQGGCKQVYNLGNGKVISILNCSTGVSHGAEEVWNWIVDDEIVFSNYLAHIGLQTQDYKKVKLRIDGQSVYVLQMTGFDSLVQQGIQVRDCKNAHHCGSTMLFGNKDNIANPNYLFQLMQPLLDDIACLLAHRVHIANCNDSFNLMIKDTADTPQHAREESGLITDRKQTLRLFFYDLSKKDYPLNFAEAIHFDAAGMQQVAKRYLQHAFDCVCNAVNDEERAVFGIGEYSPFDLPDTTFAKIENQLLKLVLEKTSQLISTKKSLPLITEVPAPDLPQMNDEEVNIKIDDAQPTEIKPAPAVNSLCSALSEYIKMRTEEIKTHRSNYNSFWARIFSKMDAVSKIESATKLLACIQNTTADRQFTNQQMATLLQGRLGQKLSLHEALLPEDFKQQRDAYRNSQHFWNWLS